MPTLKLILNLLNHTFNSLYKETQTYGFRRVKNNNFLLKKFILIFIFNSFNLLITLLGQHQGQSIS